MNQINEQRRGRRVKNTNTETNTNTNTNTNTTKPKKQTSSITWKEVNFEREDVCKGQVIEKGMRGEIVWWVQTGLSYDNPNITPDYKFGTGTEKDVVAFQLKNKNKLKVTGKVDKDTWNLLFAGSSNACPTQSTKSEEKIDNKKMEKIDNKKTETSSPTQHPLRPVRGRIGEQTTPQVETPKVKEETPSEKLKRAKFAKNENGVTCLEDMVKKLNLKENPNYGESEVDLDNGYPAYAFLGTNPKTNQEEEVFFTTSGGSDNLRFIYAGGYVVTANSSACLKRKPSYLTDEQETFLNYNVTGKSGYKVKIEPGQEQYYDGPIDITKIFAGAKDYFAPNTFFIYKRKGFGVQERNEEYYQQIETTLNKVGWTHNMPDINTDAYDTKRDIRKEFPKYAEMFPQGLFIYFTGNTRSTPERAIVTTLISDINKSNDSPEPSTCRKAVMTLWNAKNDWDRNIRYFSGDTDLEIVRDYAKRCERYFDENRFMRIFGGEAKKNFYILKGKSHGPNGVMKFNLSENFNSLIRQKLLSLKEKKENDKIKKTIVENRLKMVLELFKKEKNIEKASSEFMFELKEFNQQGLVNESFGENLKNIFGSELSSMPKTFFENIFDKILTKIDMNDSSLKKVLVIASEKNPSEMVKAFKDCDSMANLISKSISEILYSNINSDKVLAGQGLNAIKNLLGTEIKKEEFVRKIKNIVNDSLCQEFTRLTTNSQKVLSKLKGKSEDDFSVEL